MTRWRILSTPWFQVKLHCFHRSDEDRELHDHPWAFISILLRNGYNEVRPPKSVRNMLLDNGLGIEQGWVASIHDVECVRYRPGSILVRPARWAHRVQLVDGRESWSLVIVFPRVREWGFHCVGGWKDWITFHGAAGCSGDLPPMMIPGTASARKRAIETEFQS
jgi:hypothetical protein